MANKSIVVVEDERIVAKDIQISLEKLGYNVVSICSTAEEAIASAKEFNPDLFLMDIMLKGDKSGIDAAHEIKEKYNLPVIFLSAYADDNTLNKAKVSEPFGYIIKPFKETDLHTAIEIALYKHSKERDAFREKKLLTSLVKEKDSAVYVKSKSKFVKVETQNILYVEALKDYVIIHALNEKFTIHSTMKDIEQKLPRNKFLRVHRSYIVNLDHISSFESTRLTINAAEKSLPIGGSYREALVNSLKTV